METNINCFQEHNGAYPAYVYNTSNSSGIGSGTNDNNYSSLNGNTSFSDRKVEPSSISRLNDDEEPITPESVQRISHELISEQYDCVICLEHIHRTDRLWSCSSCFHVFHLRCVAQWAEAQRVKREEHLRSTSSALPSTGALGTFDCACCKSANPIASTVNYYCYCGKTRDPRVDLLLVPGSCGETCGKRRRDVHCPHRCTLICHPGGCPPCNLMRPQACYCGKTTQTVGCSSGIDGFECDNVCDKLLNCGRHRCTELCHEGPCPVCQEVVVERCYCGVDSRKRMCGTITSTSSPLSHVNNITTTITTANNNLDVDHEGMEHAIEGLNVSRSDALQNNIAATSLGGRVAKETSLSTKEQKECTNSNVMNNNNDFTRKKEEQVSVVAAAAAVVGGYSCGRRCGKMRDCGNHECGNVCHPGECEICLRLPARQKFCPCGKTRITVHRTSCLDPIPSCGLPCELPLMCGHLCWFTCHDNSPCAPCKELIKETCRCGSKTFSIPCFCQYLPQSEWKAAAKIASFPPEKLPAEYPPKCQRICRKQLSCHKHTCTEMCCVDSEHICYKICNKKLSCGVHKCGTLCHSGPCPPCTHSSYEPLYCRCRRTYIAPPVPCGTPIPSCPYPCIVPRPCGHPPMHNCHPESEPCPVCTVPVQKYCASHQQPMPYHMPCHLTDVSCGRKCHKLLTCCGRLCELSCHGGPCKHECSRSFPSFADIAKRY